MMGDAAMVRLRDGAELWTALSGTGPPVVCLHGGPGLWDYLASLARSATPRGTRTGPPPSPTSPAWAPGTASGTPSSPRDRRLGANCERLAELSAIPAGGRTPDEEREWCLLLWRTDFSPAPAAAGHARAMWDTRPPDAVVNMAANRELWDDRETEDLRLAARITCPVTMIFGNDDLLPWTASGSLLAALPDATRIVLKDAGHAPWAERPADTSRVIIDALTRPPG
jgi:proline iminopeptidase